MYTKISNFDSAKLSNVEYLQMMRNFKGFVERFDAGVLGINAVFPLFVARLNEALAALETEKSSAYSPAILDGDLLRDNDYRVLYYVVKAYTYSSRPGIREAATQLMRVLKDDENPLDAGMDRETLLLDNIASKLRTEPYAGYLATLQASGLLDDIAASNAAFTRLKSSRTDERSKVSGDVKAIRAKINPVYNNMVGTVNTLAPLNPQSQAFDEFTNLAETDVKHYRAIVAQRETRRNNTKNKGKDDKNTPGEPQE